MVTGTLAFLLGVLVLQWQPALPPASLLYFFPLLFVFYPLRHTAYGGLILRLVGASLFGFLWAWMQAAFLLSSELPPDLEGQDVVLEGVVASLPERDAQRSRFVFAVDSLRHQGRRVPSPGTVRLAWYRNIPELKAGQRWRLQVRLKRPHGMANPGLFDYEGWLFQQRLRATGYVRTSQENALLADNSGRYPLQRLRQYIHQMLRQATGDHASAGLIAALALGERQDINSEQWQLLRLTGTNHLVAISGLHVGIVAGLAFFLLRRLWRWPLLLATPKVAALAALAAAALYAALAGFSVPTQRALIMVAVAMLALLVQRNVRPVRILALALLVVLLIDPLAVLAPGFWLSFGAVAVILYGMGGRLGVGGVGWRWGRVQLLVALGLAPLLALWFGQVPLIGALANLLAVPWVSLLVVPLILLGCMLVLFWPAAAALILALALYALDGMWRWLEWCAGLLPEQWNSVNIVPWTLIPALAGVAWLLAPRGWPARWLGLIWLLPMLFVPLPAPRVGEAWIDVLDVGQGLAVLVRTANHALLYDSGPPFGKDSNAGSLVIVPLLQQYGIRQVDALILSHGDSDHSGGAATVFESLPVQAFYSGADEHYPWREHTTCAHGQAWDWDGVRFEMLWPLPGVDGLPHWKNNASCVLRIATSGGSLLLTGDIEAAAEQHLLEAIPEQLQVDVVQVPHHGSKTSSTEPFVVAMAPHHAVFSTGYLNRWGFPAQEVADRYQEHGALLYNTAQDGAVRVKLEGQGVQIEGWRQRGRRYWFD